MLSRRVGRFLGVLAGAVLLTWALSEAQAQGQAAPGKAKVDRLVLGLITPYNDYMRPWLNGTADHNIQHDPAFEWLIEIDPDTGNYVPWLADSWTVARMAGPGPCSSIRGCNSSMAMASLPPKTWCITMRSGVTPTYPGRKYPPFTANRNGICAVTRIDVVNDYEIVMHCKVVCLDMPFYYSDASNVIIFSKAQWEKEGEQGYETHPAGTGPYMFKERQLGALCALRAGPRRPTGNAARSTGKNCR